MKVEWWPSASLALLNLPMAEAKAVDEAVHRWAASGEGIVHASEGGLFFLYVGVHLVEFLIDLTEETMHIERVRRA